MKLLASIVCVMLLVVACTYVEEEECPEANTPSDSSQDPPSQPSDSPGEPDEGVAPSIFDGYWAPRDPQVEPGGVWSTLWFDMCDPDEDMLGGRFYAFEHETQSPFLMDAYLIFTEEDIAGRDYSDCDAPISIWVLVNFTGAYPPGPKCCDIMVQDTGGRVSNRLIGICVTTP